MIRLSPRSADIAVPVNGEGEAPFERSQAIDRKIGKEPCIVAAAVRYCAGGGALRRNLALVADEPQHRASQCLDRGVLTTAEVIGGGHAAPGLAESDDLTNVTNVDEIATGLRIAPDSKRAGCGQRADNERRDDMSLVFIRAVMRAVRIGQPKAYGVDTILAREQAGVDFSDPLSSTSPSISFL